MIDTRNFDPTAIDLRRLCELFPRDLALHRKFITSVADEIDRLHAFAMSQAERIAKQSELLSRQRNAAKRCLEIAREEQQSYQGEADDRSREGNATGHHVAMIAVSACRRVADRIEGEVVT